MLEVNVSSAEVAQLESPTIKSVVLDRQFTPTKGSLPHIRIEKHTHLQLR